MGRDGGVLRGASRGRAVLTPGGGGRARGRFAREGFSVIALFPGSFDPFTLGHLDVVERACAVCERLIEDATSHLRNVEVVVLSGATVDEAARMGATLIVKGVRSGHDVDYEAAQAALNFDVGGVDTWWIPTRPGLSHVSSSAVRELLSLQKDVSRYVPEAVERYLTDNRS